MPNPGIAQPDQMPEHKFRLDDVLCFEEGTITPVTSPTVVIVAGNRFRLRTDLGFDGFMDVAFIGDMYRVVHHWQRIEDGTMGHLPTSPDVPVPGGAALAHFTHLAGPYTTSGPGGGGDLEIPPPVAGVSFATGTYRITTHVHFAPPNQAIVAAFHDGLILMVISPP